MNKLDYFIKAIQLGLYAKKEWILNCFSITTEPADRWKSNPYHMRLVQTPTGHSYVDSSSSETRLVPILGGVPHMPLLGFLEPITLAPKALANVFKETETTVGNTLVNAYTIAYAFNDKIEFMSGSISAGRIEAIIADRLTDTPEEGTARVAEAIYVDEYLKFVKAMLQLTQYTQLCAIGLTPKIMLPAPGMAELKAKLLEANKDRLDDPVVIAGIEDKLAEHDDAYLKGDPGEKFFISKKSRKTVRKKLFSMTGAEIGLEDTNKVTLIQNSLYEGWDLKQMPAMIDSLRAGSYGRGAMTVLGGVAFKELLRASSNIAVVDTDCNSNLGMPILHTKESNRKLIGFTVISNGKQEIVTTQEQSDSYLGKVLMVRSPMYCKLGSTDYCRICVGVKLAENPTGVSLVLAEFGSILLSIFMQASHSKALSLSHMNINTAIT